MFIVNYITVLFFFLIAPFFCQAQQMVQTPKDIPILCQKESELIGRPLNILLKELKPSIKMVYAEGGWAEQAPHFAFFFMSKQGFDSCRKQGSLPLRLIVYVNEFFKWTYEIQGREQYLTWTKADAENYGNLIIKAIRIAGDCNLCEKSAP